MRDGKQLLSLSAVGLTIALSTAILAAAVHATGGEGIDLTGQWSIELSGSSRTCTAVMDHLPGDPRVNASLACSEVGEPRTLVGIHDPDIDGVYLSAEFWDGDTFVWRITLEGTVAPDGESFSGDWFKGIPREPEGSFTATRTGPLESPYPTLPAPVDVSGTWQVDFTGTLTGSCDAMLQQKGRALSASVLCDLLGAARLSGRIDAATGAFTLSGAGPVAGISLEGISTDGDSASGSWTASGGNSGAFTSTRSDDVSFPELHGDWDALLDEGDTATCTVSFVQDLLLLDASVDCGEFGAGEFSGSYHPALGSADLEGAFNDIRTLFGGRIVPDREAFVGSMLLTGPIESIQSHRLIAVPTGELDRGIVAVDCRLDREGLQRACHARTNEDLPIDIALVVPAAELPQTLELSLSWQPDKVDYHPLPDPNDEAAAGRCNDVQRAISDGTVSFTCTVPPDSEPGPLVTVTLTCLRDLSLFPELPRLDLESPAVDGPLLIDGLIAPCAGPEHGGYPLGDADCSGATDSIDGALVLQHSAALLAELPCSRAADADRDEVVDSIDAAIILQCTAGLTSTCL